MTTPTDPLCSLPNADVEALYADSTPLQRQAIVERLEQCRQASMSIGDLARDVVGTSYIPRPHTTELQRVLGEAVERADQGLDTNIIISMPPGSGKSMNASVVFPLWLTLHRPTWEIGLISAEASLAEKFSLDVKMQYDERGSTPTIGGVQGWTVGGKGGVIARGIHGSISGRRLRVAIIDDPIKHLSDAYSKKMRNRVWNVWTSVVKPRMRPGSIVLSIACMTGDTPVLRPDGTETPLRDIRPGDEIATYSEGALITSHVLNWANQGSDEIFAVRLESGRTVRANARHPFLTVDARGNEQWKKVSELRPGMMLRAASSTGATGQASQGSCAESTTNGTGMTSLSLLSPGVDNPARKTGAIPLSSPRGSALNMLNSGASARGWRGTADLPTSGASGRVSPALLTGVTSPLSVEGCATRTMENIGGKPGTTALLLPHVGKRKFAIGMGSPQTSTTTCFESKAASARSADVIPGTDHLPDGGSSALTTTTTPAKSEDSCATSATSSSGEATARMCSDLRLTTFSVTHDTIAAVEPVGREDVFDIQVDRTENFIANGLVSHNTRWHEDDLNGRLLKEEGWRHVVYPALAEPGDALGRGLGEPLLSVQKHETPQEALTRWEDTKRSVGTAVFNALYQQHPGDIDGTVFKLAWWRYYTELPEADQVITSWDLTFGTGGDETGDWCVGTAWQRTGNQYYLLDMIRFRGGFTVQLDRMRSFIGRFPAATAHLVERAANGAAAIATLQRELNGIVAVPVTAANGSKVVRAQSVAPLVEAHQVHLPEGARIVGDFIAEMNTFPTGEHDDIVDSTSQGLTRLRESDVGPVNVWTERPRLGGW